MKLTDADKLKEELSQQWFMDILLTQRNSEDMFYALAQKIDEQPTAYDVDKVVEQLNEASCIARPVGWSRKKEIIELKTAIEIVKVGGIDGN